MSKYNKDEILSVLKNNKDQEEDIDRELVKFESRLEDRLIEQDLRSPEDY